MSLSTTRACPDIGIATIREYRTAYEGDREGSEIIAHGRFEIRADMRASCRQFWISPITTFASVLVMALAIAANTALFTIVDRVLFRALPVAEPDRVVSIGAILDAKTHLPPSERERLGGQITAGDQLSAFAFTGPAMLLDPEADEAVQRQLSDIAVAPNFFSFVGVKPLLGRPLSEEDEQQDNPRPVVIGYDLWRTRFGASPDVLDTVTDLAGTRVHIVGVMPRGFDFPFGANVWAARLSSMKWVLPTFGRLREHVTLEQFKNTFPRLVIKPVGAAAGTRDGNVLIGLMALTMLLLVVAWIQVSGLQLLRIAQRVHEIRIRRMLGADTWALTKQFALEGAVVAALACLVAFALVPLAVDGLLRLLPAETTTGHRIAFDGRAAAFGAAVAGMSILLSALTPLRFIAIDHGGTWSGRSWSRWTVWRTHRTTHGALVILQFAVTTALVYLSVLSVQSLRRVGEVDLGVSTSGVVGVVLPFEQAGRIVDLAREAQLAEEGLREIRALPEVISASAALTVPLSRYAMLGTARLPRLSEFEPLTVRVNYVNPEYFRVLNVRPIEGVDIERQAGLEQDGFAVVNQAFANLVRRHATLIGESVKVTSVTKVIRAVVGDYSDVSPDKVADPQIFFVMRSAPTKLILAKVHGRPDESIDRMKSIVQRLWVRAPRPRAITLANEANRAVAPYRARATTLVVASCGALALGVIGLAASLMYSVRRRTQEIAIRMALGSPAAHVRRQVIMGAVWLAASGMTIGVVLGMLSGRLAASALFGVVSVEPSAVAVVGLVALLGTVGAAYLPAKRASQVDPAVVLREQ